jgi:hypothetical protein
VKAGLCTAFEGNQRLLKITVLAGMSMMKPKEETFVRGPTVKNAALPVGLRAARITYKCQTANF